MDLDRLQQDLDDDDDDDDEDDENDVDITEGSGQEDEEDSDILEDLVTFSYAGHGEIPAGMRIRDGRAGSRCLRKMQRLDADLELLQRFQESDYWWKTWEAMGVCPPRKCSAEAKEAAAASASTAPRQQKQPLSDGGLRVPSAVTDRQVSAFGFTQGHRYRLMDNFIPNRKVYVKRVHRKLFCGSYSDCGNLFLAAGQDTSMYLFDATGYRLRLKRVLEARDVGWSVLDAAISPDSRHLVYCSWNNLVYQVDIGGSDRQDLSSSSDPGETQRGMAVCLETEGSRFCVFSVKFSRCGRDLLCGGKDGSITLFDRESGTRVHSFRTYSQDHVGDGGHDAVGGGGIGGFSDVNAVSFVDEGSQLLASGSDDGLLKLWDARILKESHPVPVGVFAGHLSGVTFVDSKGDGRHLISNSKDQSIKLWDLRRFSSLDDVKTFMRLHCQWDYRWSTVPPAFMTRQSTAVNDRDDCSLMTYRSHVVQETLIRCRFSPMHTTGQRYIYTGSSDGVVIIYDSLTGEVVERLDGHSHTVRDVSWHPFRNEIMTTSWDKTLSKWAYHPGYDCNNMIDPC